MTVVISCDCPFIEGMQTWQNQFPMGSDVSYFGVTSGKLLASNLTDSAIQGDCMKRNNWIAFVDTTV